MALFAIAAHAAGGPSYSQEIEGEQKSSDALVVQAEPSTGGDNGLPAAAPKDQTITLAAHETDLYLMEMRADIAANKAGIEYLIASVDRLERSVIQQIDSLKVELKAEIRATNDRIDTTNDRIDNLLMVLLYAAAGFIGVMLSILLKNLVRRYKNTNPPQKTSHEI